MSAAFGLFTAGIDPNITGTETLTVKLPLCSLAQKNVSHLELSPDHVAVVVLLCHSLPMMLSMATSPYLIFTSVTVTLS